MTGKSERIVDLGDWTIELLSDGYVWLDGGAMFGITPKRTWKKCCPPDDKNRIQLALNCLLMRREDQIILLEGGVGEGHSEKFRKIYGVDQDQSLLEQLEERNLGVEDIHHYIFTHLHFDHSGWLTRPGDDGYSLTFPKAPVYVQKDHLKEAYDPHRTIKASFLQDRLAPLKDSPQLQALEGEGEILPQIFVKITEGHTEGHQSVIIKGKERTLCYTGDLIPTASHLPLQHIMAYDRHPLKTLSNKKKLLREAAEKEWILVFPHEPKKNFLQVRLDGEGQFAFKSIFESDDNK